VETTCVVSGKDCVAPKSATHPRIGCRYYRIVKDQNKSQPLTRLTLAIILMTVAIDGAIIPKDSSHPSFVAVMKAL
jgi:hypothetical protein